MKKKPDSKPGPDGERLQKVLAASGLGSRREIERWIDEGRLSINEKIARLGDRVVETDLVKLDGKPLAKSRLGKTERRIILYNKPEGELVTRHDPEGRSTVFKHLPRLQKGRWIAVGRLDINSSGLMIFTTDGELANRLMHPSHKIDREYAVRVMGKVTEEMLTTLVNGIELDDGFARFEDIVESGGSGINRWFHTVIMDGRKREVRRLWEAVGVKVNRLKRVRFGSLILDSSVKVGQWRELTPDESRELLAIAGMQDIRQRPAGKPGGGRPLKKPAKRKSGPWRKHQE